MAHRPKIDNAAKTARSKQNLSCNWTGSADFGRLIPIHWEELVEGDHVIKCRPRIEMQLLPLAAPTFGKIVLYCHYFVVPLRLCWQSFYDVWSQTGVNKNNPFPHFTPKDLAVRYNNDLQQDAFKRAAFKHWTSLGLNPFFTLPVASQTDNETPIWFMPFEAYNQIWWDFYRDPEVIRDESKMDYLYTGEWNNNDWNAQDFVNRYMLPHVRSIKNNWISDLFASNGDLLNPNTGESIFPVGSKFPYKNVEGEQSNLSLGGLANGGADTDLGTTFPALETARMNRLFEALNRLSERLSLSGKRQIEALFARYGVKPKWSEMNMCRYVGGAKQEVIVDNIISHADTNGEPLGAKAGTGYCALDSLNIKCSVDEPSILMGIVSVMPHIHYVQGLSKKWQRSQLTDMFQDSLQYVGQVAVSKREVAMKYRSNQSYVPGTDAETFAFSDPYYEYKMGLDTLAGDFMTYHGVELPTDPQAKKDVLYMQSMEQYIDFPYNRLFNLDNLLIDGDQYNKIFKYLGGSVFEDVDDHFHLSIEKDVIIDRPMEGYAIPTLETTKDPHKETTTLSQDTIL